MAHALWARAPWPRVEHWTGEVDVVHATNFVAPPSRAPVVVTVHDLAFAHSPELCRPETLAYEPLLRQAIERGALVHTVSDFVAAEVRDYFDLPAERVARVYAGIAATGGGDASGGSARSPAAAPYVLAMGTIEPRKNLPVLVRAFDVVAAAHDDDVCSSSSDLTGGGRRRSTTRSRALGSALGSDASDTSPTRNAPTSSRAHRCSRTPRSTRVSVTPRSRPWPRACRS